MAFLSSQKETPACSSNDIILWNKDTFNKLPVLQYEENFDEKHIQQWINIISKYGFALVDNIPVDPEITRQLISKISKPQNNFLWGDWWDYEIQSGTIKHDITDTAYTGDSIPPHTDCTYLFDTPGLQFFHVLKFKGSGGVTTLVDGFQIAKKIQETHPEVYEFLSRFPIEWYFLSDVHNIRSFKPIISINPNFGHVEQISFNDLDRAPPPASLDVKQLDLYYTSVRTFITEINNAENQIQFTLVPGRLMVTNNWRVFHARSKFEGQRRICGCYIAMDQFRSRLSMYSKENIFV